MEKIKSFFHKISEFYLFALEAVRNIPNNIKKPQEFVKNLFGIGIESVPIVLVTGFFIGIIMGLQISDAIERIIQGTVQYASGAISLMMLKEIGPVFTALIVVSRVCSSVTAHLGTMRVTEQIDALSTFAVNPISYLVTPRMMAGMVALPILGAISIMASMVGSWLAIRFLFEIPTVIFMEVAQIPLQISFVFESMVKMSVIGGAILLVSTYQGFKAKGGAAGVGEATIRSVVQSSLSVILLDFVMGAVFLVFSSGSR